MKKNPKSRIDIDHVAILANLELSEKEKKTFGQQLTKVLDYVVQIESVDTKNTDPTFNVSTNKNITRADKTGPSLTRQEALSNATSVKNGQFVTKGVFEE